MGSTRAFLTVMEISLRHEDGLMLQTCPSWTKYTDNLAKWFLRLEWAFRGYPPGWSPDPSEGPLGPSSVALRGLNFSFSNFIFFFGWKNNLWNARNSPFEILSYGKVDVNQNRFGGAF